MVFTALLGTYLCNLIFPLVAFLYPAYLTYQELVGEGKEKKPANNVNTVKWATYWVILALVHFAVQPVLDKPCIYLLGAEGFFGLFEAKLFFVLATAYADLLGIAEMSPVSGDKIWNNYLSAEWKKYGQQYVDFEEKSLVVLDSLPTRPRDVIPLVKPYLLQIGIISEAAATTTSGGDGKVDKPKDKPKRDVDKPKPDENEKEKKEQIWRDAEKVYAMEVGPKPDEDEKRKATPGEGNELELGGKKMKELKVIAKALGASADELEDFDRTDDAIKYIVAKMK